METNMDANDENIRDEIHEGLYAGKGRSELQIAPSDSPQYRRISIKQVSF
jgi:hypothetical protein